jgi:hypothetical protein
MTAQILQADKSFADYVDYIFKSVLESMTRNELNEIQSLAIFLQLSSAKNKQELVNIVDTLIAKYPTLKEVGFKEKMATKQAYDQSVQVIISNLIKNGKSKEAELFSKRATELNTNLTELQSEFAEYFNLYL